MAVVADDQLDVVFAQWTRIGASFTTAPAAEPVDLGELISTTAYAAPDNVRLFVVAASWLATHHAFVNGPRLALMARDLQRGLRAGRRALSNERHRPFWAHY